MLSKSRRLSPIPLPLMPPEKDCRPFRGAPPPPATPTSPRARQNQQRLQHNVRSSDDENDIIVCSTSKLFSFPFYSWENICQLCICVVRACTRVCVCVCVLLFARDPYIAAGRFVSGAGNYLITPSICQNKEETFLQLNMQTTTNSTEPIICWSNSNVGNSLAPTDSIH